MMGGYVTEGVGRRLLYKVLETRASSSVCSYHGRDRLYVSCHVLMCRRISQLMKE